MAVTFAELTVRSLVANGASAIYCLPGVQNDDFFDALHGAKDELEVVHTRHEQTAAYMAMGAALATGRSQALCVVPGPGFLNASAGLATAGAVNARVLAIVGDVPSIAKGKGYGLLHEVPDQFGMLSQLTKFAVDIAAENDLFNSLTSALSALECGRPGPVGLNVPTDMWTASVQEGGTPAMALPEQRLSVDQNGLDRAAEVLGNAERPLIVVGGGAQSDSGAVRRFAQALLSPTTAFRNGHGILPFDDPLFVPLPVAHELWGHADVVVGLGTRLQTQQMQWGVDDDLRIVHIDIDDSVIGRISEPTVGIHAALNDVLPSLTAAIEGRCRDRKEWLATAAEIRERVELRIERKLAGQLSFLRAIRTALPNDGILVDEVTQMGYVAKFAFPCLEPRTFLSAGHQGNLGCGFPTALGAAHARRDVPVVSISGDGGFMYAVGELATAVRHDIPVKVIVFTDDSFGNVKRVQQEAYGGRLLGVDLVNPDFAELARNFGVAGVRADSPESLHTALSRALDSEGPCLIEVPVGEFESPWEFILMPLVRRRRPVGTGTDKLF